MKLKIDDKISKANSPFHLKILKCTIKEVLDEMENTI